LESSWGALSDGTISFFNSSIFAGKYIFLNFSQKTWILYKLHQSSVFILLCSYLKLLLTSKYIILMVLIRLRSNFDEAVEAVIVDKLVHQIFIIL
jgi:hypothetical protein